jgi:hypothetical protein
MNAEPATPAAPTPRWSALAWLAPAALGLLPAVVLAFSPGAKGEPYEWIQHRVAGAGFAVTFLLVFFRGPWRRSVLAAIAGAGTFVALAAATWPAGLPGFHPLFAVAGLLVAAGYWATRREAVAESALVGLVTVACFWAASRLSWWQPFTTTLDSWANQAIFLGVTAALVWLLHELTVGRGQPGGRWLTWALDLLVLAVLAASVARTNLTLTGPEIPHHWSFFTAPAQMVRDGGAPLHNVPAQYGLLTTILLAALPTDDCYTSLYWLNTVVSWLSGAVIYFVLRTWLARWWWQVLAGLTTVGAVAFLCGNATLLTGSLPFPSTGAVRFIGVELLLGYLLFRHRQGKDDPASIRRALWAGSGFWLFGVLWSFESAIYVTAAWLPAATLLAMPPETAGRLRAFLVGARRAVLIPGLLGAILFVALTGFYFLATGVGPVWSYAWEHALAFSGGYGALPIQPQGGVWILLLIHTLLIAVLAGLDVSRRRSSLALVWAAWGALWTVSTYYVARSHLNNLTNLGPLLLLIVGLTVHAWGPGGRRDQAAPWVWVTVPTVVGALLWLVLTNSSALKRQWETYAVQPQIARLLPESPADLTQIIGLCEQLQPGPYSILLRLSHLVDKAETSAGHDDWLPVRSMPIYDPLPVRKRWAHFDDYSRGHKGGWLIMPLNANAEGFAWFLDYVAFRFTRQFSFVHGTWRATYYLPRTGKLAPPAVTTRTLALADSGLPEETIAGRKVRVMTPPAAFTWPLQGDERELILEVGATPPAGAAEAKAGALFITELTLPSGAIVPIHFRWLDPQRNSLDLGLVNESVTLPPFPPGSRLTVRSAAVPVAGQASGPAYLAEASVVTRPDYSSWQFPGFNRTPEAVTCDAAYYSVAHGRLALCLRAPASVAFRLHGGERTVAFDFGLQAGGQADGAGYRVTLRRPGQPETVVFERQLQPVAHPADQGNQHAAVSLPAEVPAGAELVLSLSPGPAGNAAWDWAYLANLRIN